MLVPSGCPMVTSESIHPESVFLPLRLFFLCFLFHPYPLSTQPINFTQYWFWTRSAKVTHKKRQIKFLIIKIFFLQTPWKFLGHSMGPDYTLKNAVLAIKSVSCRQCKYFLPIYHLLQAPAYWTNDVLWAPRSICIRITLGDLTNAGSQTPHYTYWIRVERGHLHF